jgi:hypothetical protein
LPLGGIEFLVEDAPIPDQRICAIRAFRRSRIVITLVEMEEIPGDLLQDHRSRRPRSKRPNCSACATAARKGAFRISPPECQQAAQRPHPAAMRLPDQRRDVRVEHGWCPCSNVASGGGVRSPALRCRVVPGQLLLRIAHADQARVHRDDLRRAHRSCSSPEYRYTVSVFPTQRSGTE